ncbi:MAG: hypothetical protein LBU74_01020 [Methanobacteriaceae archaeon]|jgi:hypothetical protein|nr:hypothetical protein [Candidatus Methanorudis spinitermitis]
MIINYLLLIICGIYSVFGIISWRRESLYSYPALTIGAIIIFVLALIATLQGITIYELKYLIEKAM